MRVAYFDCFSGISGDMFIGSLLDAGLDLKELKRELDKLSLQGYRIGSKKEKRGILTGTKFYVDVLKNEKNDIFSIIRESGLTDDIKEKSRRVFQNLISAEAKIHGASNVHLHETGDLDAIIDIVGAIIATKQLGIEAIFSSRLNLGTGFLECEHGRLPVPAPATVELLRGVPVYSSGVEAELVTPTGAAIIRTLASSFGNMIEMKIETIGYGLGRKELPVPNALRVLIGKTEIEYDDDTVTLLETNIDDMNPQIYEHLMAKLFKSGALDVFFTPIYMKKSRPGLKLSVLSPLEKRDEHLRILFQETTTFGIRIEEIRRKKLRREDIVVETCYGKIRVKKGIMDGDIKYSPEYEDCRKAAEEHNVPLKRVYEEVAKRISVIGNQ